MNTHRAQERCPPISLRLCRRSNLRLEEKGCFFFLCKQLFKLFFYFCIQYRLGFEINDCSCAPLSKNAVSAFQMSCKLLSFPLQDSCRNHQRSSVTKGSTVSTIPYQTYTQLFTTVVDWPNTGCLMEVSSMFYICRYCVLLGTAEYSVVSNALLTQDIF